MPFYTKDPKGDQNLDNPHVMNLYLYLHLYLSPPFNMDSQKGTIILTTTHILFPRAYSTPSSGPVLASSSSRGFVGLIDPLMGLWGCLQLPTWKASSLYLGATFSQLWATLGYSGLFFWATWRSRKTMILVGSLLFLYSCFCKLGLLLVGVLQKRALLFGV